MLETVQSIYKQVDRVFIVLNEYKNVPQELNLFGNIEAIIPNHNLKDTGKFYFSPDTNDIVFTIDDDIIYPPDYVTKTLRQAERIGLDKNIVGYQANTWVYKKNLNSFGWRNFMFFKPLKKLCLVDVIGTGTACMLGKNTPMLLPLKGSEGFVDIRYSNIQKDNFRKCWSLPRAGEYLKRNLPDHLQGSSLFNTVTRNGTPELYGETSLLMSKIRATIKKTDGLK